MGWFVRHELMEKTSDDALPVLADAILANPDDVKKLGEFDRRELNGALTRRLLEVHGNIAKPGQIYTWLGIYMDKYHSAYINKEDSVAVHDYFEAHPEFYAQLFRHWLDQTVPDEKQNYRYHHIDLQNRILLVAPPLDFPETLLTWAAAETDIDKATFLFDEAADMIMRGDPGAFGVDLEGLCEYVEVHPAFAEIWSKKGVAKFLNGCGSMHRERKTMAKSGKVSVRKMSPFLRLVLKSCEPARTLKISIGGLKNGLI